MSTDNKQVIEMLQTAYSMELETVMNYIATSVNLDGVRAEEIKNSLAGDIAEELSHAQQLAQRIKQIGGLTPGSAAVSLGNQIQPSDNTTDVVHAIKAVIDAEQSAIDHYKSIIRETDGKDYVTQDLCIRLLADEEAHLILFRGFLKEYAGGEA